MNFLLNIIKWLKVRENINLLIAIIAVSVSVFSLYFTIFKYNIDYRPFVGIVSVQAINEKEGENILSSDADIIILKTEVKNMGKLPAHGVTIFHEWEIHEKDVRGNLKLY